MSISPKAKFGFATLMLLFSTVSPANPGVSVPSPICMYDLSLGELDPSPEWLRTATKEAVKTIMDNSAPPKEVGNPEVGFYKGQFRASGDLLPGDEKLPYQTAVYAGQVWQRDAGVTTNALVEALLDDEMLEDDVFNNPAHTLVDRKKIVLQTLMDNLAYQKTIQGLDSEQLGGAGVYTKNINGQNVQFVHPAYGLAKRNLDLTEPSWMNPQIDGTGYEQKSNLRLANYIWDKWGVLFSKFSSLRTNLSRDDIYRTKDASGDVKNSNSILKNFFEYILHNWRDESYEMWEEEKSKAVDPAGRGHYSGGHFATIGALQAVMLIEGPEFTAKVGDPGAGHEYRRVGIEDIEPFLKNNFWDAKYKVIKSSLPDMVDSQPNKNGHPKFITDDPRVFNGVSAAAPIDAQFLIGLCHMKSPAFMLSGDMAMSSIYQAEMLFKGFYPINHGKNVVLWGRYINDIYSGMFEKENKVVDGQSRQIPILKSQPWSFTTEYVAEAAAKAAEEFSSFGVLRHTIAHAIKSKTEVKLDAELAKFFFKLALKENPKQAIETFDQLPIDWPNSGFTIKSSDASFSFLKSVAANQRLVINDLNVDYLNMVLGQVGYPDRVKLGQRIASASPIMKKIVTAHILRGDMVMQEVLKYKDAQGGLSEQISPDANDGTPSSSEIGAQRQRSAPKLTWSSAVVIRYKKARKRAIARASELDTTLITNTPIAF